MLFNAVHEPTVQASPRAGEYAALQQQFDTAYDARRAAAVSFAQSEGTADEDARAADFKQADATVKGIRQKAVALVREAAGDSSYNDVNYVFPTFITTALPIGLVGLWIVAIITAATDTIAAELNSLASVSVMDFYRRYLRGGATDSHYLLVAKVATAFWGVFAGVVAVYAADLGSLIVVVNRFGSYFYGSILGVFMLAVLTKRTSGTGAFLGLVAGMASVYLVATYRPEISFLWHNVLGAVVVFVVGLFVSLVSPRPPAGAGAAARAA
jgi:Na+/proline symporter